MHENKGRTNTPVEEDASAKPENMEVGAVGGDVCSSRYG